MMKFSVLMSVYHKEKAEYLDDAMKSILNQTLLPDEIVIVRDGPLTTELDRVIQKYTSTNETIKVITLEKNAGLGIALSEGIKHCQYDIIARADSDDISLSYRFERQINYLKAHPEIDIIGSNIVEFDETLTVRMSNRVLPRSDDEIKSFLKKRCPFNHMTVMYKKNTIQRAGGYQDCTYFEDYYLWCRVCKNGATFYNIQDTLVYARGGISLIARRGGLQYISHIYSFQRKLYALGLIGKVDFIVNVLVRGLISAAPKSARGMFYKRALRK